MANKDIMKPIVARMRERSGMTLLSKVRGHTGIRGNEEADRLANIGARKAAPDEINIDCPPVSPRLEQNSQTSCQPWQLNQLQKEKALPHA